MSQEADETDSPEPLDDLAVDDDYLEEETALHPGSTRLSRTLVAIGGGRGGAGHAILAQNLAVYFAQLGKPVLLVDRDPAGANLHVQFGVSARASHDDELTDEVGEETSVPGLRLLSYGHDSSREPQQLRGSRRAKWVSQLRRVNAEYIIVHLGPGQSPFSIDLLLGADIPIVVTSPEPPAIESVYRLLRVAFLRRMRKVLHHDRLRLSLYERIVSEFGKLPAPVDAVRAAMKVDLRLGELAWAECSKLVMFLLVNQTRERNDADIGLWMKELALRHYGCHLEELGHVEHDDNVWLAVRRRRPVLLDSPASKASRSLERVARKVAALSLSSGQERTSSSMPVSLPAPEPAPLPPLIATHYALLGQNRGSSDEDIRRAYKKRREVYSELGLPVSSLLSNEELRILQARLDEAYDTLLDPIRKRAYDLSTFPEDAEAPSVVHKSTRPPEELRALEEEILREIGPETEFTGPLLRRVREARGIELQDVSARTKIPRAYLLAIEEENRADLPAPVYIRGFVAELAKLLRLDPLQVQRTYMRRMNHAISP